MRPWLLVAALVVSGCTAPDASAPAKATGTSDRAPGVVLRVEALHDAPTHRVAASARNEGAATWLVRGACETPWSESHVDPAGRAFEPEQPRVHCLALSWERFAPGAERLFEAWWNETRWDAGGHRTVRADTGPHRWTVAFAVYADQADAARAVQATVAVQVR